MPGGMAGQAGLGGVADMLPIEARLVLVGVTERSRERRTAEPGRPAAPGELRSGVPPGLAGLRPAGSSPYLRGGRGPGGLWPRAPGGEGPGSSLLAGVQLGSKADQGSAGPHLEALKEAPLGGEAGLPGEECCQAGLPAPPWALLRSTLGGLAPAACRAFWGDAPVGAGEGWVSE
jgi:hypothetical protein